MDQPHAPDQASEDLEMGTTFVDTHGDAARATIAELLANLTATVYDLERADETIYRSAIRMMLAAEAALDSASDKLQKIRLQKHQAWTDRQRAAIEYLEVRATGSGREFIVAKQIADTGRKRWPGLPPAGKRFRFTIEKSPALTGAPFGRRAALETFVNDGFSDAEFREYGTMALQALHRAFLDHAVVDAVPDLLDTVQTFQERADQLLGRAPAPSLAQLGGPIDVPPEGGELVVDDGDAGARDSAQRLIAPEIGGRRG